MNLSFDTRDDVFLVYLRGQRGIESQKIPAPAGCLPPLEKPLQARLVARHKLEGAERDKSFAELKTIHPPPEVPADG
jgi:hypothetical protein